MMNSQTVASAADRAEQLRIVAAQARAESVLLRLCAKSLYRPTVELAREIQEGIFAGDLRNLLGECPDSEIAAALDALDACGADLEGLDLVAARLVLEVDYNRLFVGPSVLLAPPYESFYTTASQTEGQRGVVRGPAERAVRTEYAKHGLAMPEEFVEFPDHIAVELEFLSLLAAHEAEAWERGDEESARSLQEDQERFREQHLGRWIEAFATEVDRSARTAFYAAAVRLAERVVVV